MVGNEVKGMKRQSLLPSWGCAWTSFRSHVSEVTQILMCNAQTSRNGTGRQVTSIHRGHTGENENKGLTVICMSLSTVDLEGH